MTQKEVETLTAIRELAATNPGKFATHEQLSTKLVGNFENELASLVRQGHVEQLSFEMFKPVA